MGQSLMKLSPGGGEQIGEKEKATIIEECYNKFFSESKKKMDDWTLADFYHAVSQTVEDINKKLHSAQFRIPNPEKLNEVYDKRCKGKGPSLKREEFQEILQEVIIHSGFTGFGSKDVLLYMFGIPAVSFFIKQRLAPKAVPDDVFIPTVTSATAYILSKLHKI